MAKLAAARVLVVGLGGVGSWAAEFLVRGGVGHMTIIDDDVVDPTNRNRQLPALSSTHGMPKTDVMAARLRDINPMVKVVSLREFVPADPAAVDGLISRGMGPGKPFDFVIDAIDSLQPKVELIRASLKHRVRIVSSMGAGGRLDPGSVLTADLSQLQWDRETIRASNKAGGNVVVAHEKLGTYVRKKLAKDYGIVGGVLVVTSSEMPRKAFELGSHYARFACVVCSAAGGRSRQQKPCCQ